MPNRTSYPQGTPCWTDLQTSDQDAAKRFYADLFGWSYDDQPMPDGGPAVYAMAMKGNGVVAAIAPQSADMAAQGVPPAWNTYLAVDDVDAASERAKAAGGQVIAGPFDVGAAGRMSFVTDPTGAAVGLWQAGQHIGATLVNETGGVVWNELVSSDLDRATAFYREVLGLEASSQDFGGQPYTMLAAGGRTVGGAMKPAMAGVPNHWNVYFTVDDVPATIDRATALGGGVNWGPMDTPIGPLAGLRDPQGAAFSICAPTTPPSE